MYTLFPPFQGNRPWLPRNPMNGEQHPMVLKSRDTTQTMDDILSKCFKTQLKITIRILYFVQLLHITRTVSLSITLKFLLWEKELSFYMHVVTGLKQSLTCYAPLPC